MVRKRTSKNKKKKNNVKVAADKSLPQNIVSYGVNINDNKVVYINQNTYKTIFNFTKGKIENESGGILVGNVLEEFGKQQIIVRGFIELKYCECTPTTLTFTHKSWDYVHEIISIQYPEYQIVGWIHTHPNFGIFLSEYDRFIHENFFSDENQIAYVIDTVQNTDGIFYWKNGCIERMGGYYLFDQPGITVKPAEEPKSEEDDGEIEKTAGLPFYCKALFVIFGALIAVMFVFNIMLFMKINNIQDIQHENIVNNNTAFEEIETYINNNLQEKINDIESRITMVEESLSAYDESEQTAEDEITDGTENQTTDTVSEQVNETDGQTDTDSGESQQTIETEQ